MKYDNYFLDPISTEYISIDIKEIDSKGVERCSKCGGEFEPKNITNNIRCKKCLSYLSILEDTGQYLYKKLIEIKRNKY